MPFGCSASDSAMWKIRFVPRLNGTVWVPNSESSPASSAFASCESTLVGTTSCGVSPIRPRITALSVAWPMPVSASEPYSAACTPTTSSKGPHSIRKRRAATIGPTVWELDGPMPILNRSNTLIAIAENLRSQDSRRPKHLVTELLRSKLRSAEMAASSVFCPQARRLTPTYPYPPTPVVQAWQFATVQAAFSRTCIQKVALQHRKNL